MKMNYSIIKIKTIMDDRCGQISFFEGTHDIPFAIKRVYYITKVPEGKMRGYHAHKNLKQMLFCPYGRIKLILDNGIERDEILLEDPSVGVLIKEPLWREMLWLQSDSVLCVAVSEYYDADDYIRDYQKYHEYLNLTNESIELEKNI